jgi:hypothetical protein
VEEDRQDSVVAPFSLKAYLAAAKDYKIWLFAMLFLDTTTISYALAYFMPVILYGMGYSVGAAQCLTAPPYVFAGFNMFFCGWLGDKYHIRGPIIVWNMLLCLIGLPIVGWHHSNAWRFFGIFLVTAGANANVPTGMCIFLLHYSAILLSPANLGLQ